MFVDEKSVMKLNVSHVDGYGRSIIKCSMPSSK